MHKISEFFFEYILFPTAVVAYVVMIWGLIVWGIGTINQMRRDQMKVEREQGDNPKAEGRGLKAEDGRHGSRVRSPHRVELVPQTARADARPTLAPTAHGDSHPTLAPTARADARPTLVPTARGYARPTLVPTARGYARPTLVPTAREYARPTLVPTARADARPTELKR